MRFAKTICLAGLCLVLTACSPSTEPLTPTAFVTPTPTAALAPTDCIWNWNTRPLDDLSRQVQTALESVDVTGATASAVAFGEDCIDPHSGEVKRFATMETDFHFTLPTSDLEDLDELGHLAETVLEVLDSFPTESTPGPQPGYVGLTFVADGETLHLWFKVTRADEARQQGLHGAALLEALGG